MSPDFAYGSGFRGVKVWRRRGERYADCCTDRITSLGGGSVMVWGGISLTGKTGLVIIGGNLNAEIYRDEILQPVAIPYLHSLGPNSILQDDSALPHRAGFIRDYLQNVGVERMEWPLERCRFHLLCTAEVPLSKAT
uniref:Tc1-like transposase DDE domain-containing protein n=1 Tax=Dicentrarchus labrax TaxID=13489 RepID=A0A8P4G4U6_DICLA